MLVGDFNVEPTKIPCLAKGISAGLWVDLEVSWALAAGRQPSSTCMREWGSGGGTRRDFLIGCPLAAAAVLTCTVQPDRWIAPHPAVLTFGLLLGCLLLIKVGVQSRLRFGEFGKFMMIVCSSCLGRMLFFWVRALNAGDVSQAWLVWFCAAETALADAYRFSGGPAPE